MLRTDNGPQYVSERFRTTVKILGIRMEYIQKHTPGDNGDIESFHNSLKTDYIWVNDIETFEYAEKLIEYAFNDYNSIRPHSSICYLPPDQFERRREEKEAERKCLIGRENYCLKLRGLTSRSPKTASVKRNIMDTPTNVARFG